MYPSDENSKLWTAGVFDGDGCVSANPRGGGVSVMFDQAEKGWKMLRRLHERWGGIKDAYPYGTFCIRTRTTIMFSETRTVTVFLSPTCRKHSAMRSSPRHTSAL